MASQKSGMATAMLEPTVTPRSRSVPWCSPEMIPAGSPMRMAMNMPPAATLSVTGNRAAIPDATVSWLNSEFPRFPPSAALSQFQYWAKKPSFRCSCAVIFAISAGVALVPPARAMAGLPGMMRMSE